MPQRETTNDAWILMLRAQGTTLYENVRGTIAAVHTFGDCEPDSIAAWLEDAHGAGRFRKLKLIGDPPALCALMVRMSRQTRSLLVDVRTEDLSRVTESCDACDVPAACAPLRSEPVRRPAQAVRSRVAS